MSSDLLPLLQSIANRLGAIEEKIGISSGEDAGDAEELPRSIKAYDAYFNESVQPFVDACNKLGGDAVKIGNAVKEAFSEKRNFLEMAAKCKVSLDTMVSVFDESAIV